jgi:hypothetical protein
MPIRVTLSKEQCSLLMSQGFLRLGDFSSASLGSIMREANSDNKSDTTNTAQIAKVSVSQTETLLSGNALVQALGFPSEDALMCCGDNDLINFYSVGMIENITLEDVKKFLSSVARLEYLENRKE